VGYPQVFFPERHAVAIIIDGWIRDFGVVVVLGPPEWRRLRRCRGRLLKIHPKPVDHHVPSGNTACLADLDIPFVSGREGEITREGTPLAAARCLIQRSRGDPAIVANAVLSVRRAVTSVDEPDVNVVVPRGGDVGIKGSRMRSRTGYCDGVVVIRTPGAGIRAS